MKLIVDLDEYLIEHCKRHVKEHYSNRIEEAIASGIPQKMGYWMDSSNGWTCSECIRDNISDTKYCPNCGAKMEG